MTDQEEIMPAVGGDFEEWAKKWNEMWLQDHDMYGRHRPSVFEGMGFAEPGNEGEIKQTIGGEVVNARHKGHHGITVASADSPQWLRDMADFHPGMSGSDSSHLQAAIDQAESYPSVFYAGGAPPVLLAAGNHYWDTTVTKRTSAVMSIGEGSIPVAVRWEGAPGQIAMITQEWSNSFGRISGIRFIPGGEDGDNHPGHWIDFSASGTGVDAFSGLEWVQFVGGNVPIKVGTFFNAHWSHLRFDSWNDVAIELNPAAGQFASSFSLDQFTADNGVLGSDASNRGFIRVVMPEGGAVPHGIVSLSNARIEYNRPLLPGVGGILICEWPEPNLSHVIFSMSNILFQDQVESVNSHLIYHDSPRGEVSPIPSRGSAFYSSGIAGGTHAGDLASWFVSPPVINLTLMDWNVQGLNVLSESRKTYSGEEDWEIEANYVRDEEVPRHTRSANGTYTWGEETSLAPRDGGGLAVGGGISANSAITTESAVTAKGGFAAQGGRWDEGHVKLGDMHIWRSGKNVPMVGAGELHGDGSGQTFSSVPYTTRVVTSSTTLTPLDSTVLVDADAGPVTIRLPGIGTLAVGTTYRIKKIDNSANAVAIAGEAGETIDGNLSAALGAQFDYMEITAANGSWYVIGGNL